MYRSHLEVQRPSRQIRILTGLVVLCLGQGCLQTAGAAESTAVMKYAAASGFAAAAEDQRFQLIAGEIELGDDCNPLPLAASSLGTEPIVLAKADDDKKNRRKKHVKEEEPKTMIDAVPMASAPLATPASMGLSAAGTRDWEIIVSDKTLNATLARWAASAGWQLLWELPVDYAVEARTRVSGTFEEAVSIVASSMESAEIPMKAVFYQGNKVLRIMAKGSE
ncbi:toxin co-regulated pilus biosynthesis Q family protein [Herbaspirillum sp. YR522]|uniref:toxin co-regulated pilus biosynthesis Q family protein n=1 Tax=Herbaspirillum sp. YR522 TaxID=1144342 RepID=UPI00026F913F|nr:toxin co-regulated pilus biosynthesis Q family protein [Herbaspirillum sp. YR522]EJN02932.1 Toxin co-regulated pilus biosynthesis protein Q [Herbaspirillum sp. YR522]